MISASIGVDHPDERAERVPIIQDAIAATVAFINTEYPGSVGTAGNISAIVTTNCYFLLSNAYKRARLINDNRTYDYKVAAITAAAIMAVRPVRFARQIGSHEDLIRFANWDCATRASLSYLGIALDQFDSEFVRRFHRAVLGSVRLPCLSSYLQQFDNLIFMKGYPHDTSFNDVESAIPFAPFNNIDLRGRQMVQIEQLITVYLLFKMNKSVFGGD